MADLGGFDANTVSPDDFPPIPEGRYVAMIIASERKPTKKGDGHYLELTFQVTEGPHKDRQLCDRLNLEHPKAETVAIARATLSAICHSVGVMKPSDSTELHNLPLTIKVKTKIRKDNGEPSNEIKGYAKRESAGQSPQAGDGPSPWKPKGEQPCT